MGPSATTLMMRRSRVPCGRSNLFSVFMPMASTYTLEHVSGQGVCFEVYGSPPQPRVDPHKRKLHPATVASMRLQSAILERRNPEFVDNYCEQANALIDAPRVGMGEAAACSNEMRTLFHSRGK